MGTMTALGYKEMVDEGQMSLENALTIHLRSNHYPPIPSSMIRPCMRAIEKANRGEWNKKVRLPEGVEHRVYGRLVPVHELVNHAHLDTFLDLRYDELEDEFPE